MISSIIQIKIAIQTLSGLTIGGNEMSMSIGGLDTAVVRNSITKEPYIPGSTLKGKLRSLIEINKGLKGEKMSNEVECGPCENPKYVSTWLFGNTANKEKGWNQITSRLLVRDAQLSVDSVKNLSDADTDQHLTESKIEVVIDRITSAAMPRTIERVPAGVTFEGELILRCFQDDNFDETKLLTELKNALNYLNFDYLGGNGSRGSGQVSIEVTSIRKLTFSQESKCFSGKNYKNQWDKIEG